jgi:hypothetical protein
MIFVTLDAPRKGLQNPFNVQGSLTNVKKVIKLYLQRFFTYLVYLIEITICFCLNKHTSNILSHILYREKNSTKLYKDIFFPISSNIVLHVWNAMEHKFYSLDNSSKKNRLNVVLFSIGYSNRENYVAARFFAPQGGKNQMVGFFALYLGGHPIPFIAHAKKELTQTYEGPSFFFFTWKPSGH